MQSGISASAELQKAFNNFTSDNTLFALPVTISGEALQPLDPVSFTSSDFKASLPSLSAHLQQKTPIFLLLRQSASTSATGNLVAVTFIPYNAPVRSKTLFASTRATLVRDLGLEKFTDNLFVTEVEEVLDPAQWEERWASQERRTRGVDTTLLTTEERELQSVRRAEEEERHGTSGRDLMGDGGSGTSWSGGRGGSTAASSGIMVKVNDDAKAAFGALKDSASQTEGGYLAQFGIDLPTETLVLSTSATGVSASDVPRRIPADKPSYTFYHFPGTNAVIFIYTCPGTAKVRERMVYASTRNGVVEVARSEGVLVKSKLEAGGPEDISEQRLQEEAGINEAPSEGAGLTGQQKFARPKRPGRR